MYVFLPTFRVFHFPQFDHDAFMHHTMHVLDAPAMTFHTGADITNVSYLARSWISRPTKQPI